MQNWVSCMQMWKERIQTSSEECVVLEVGSRWRSNKRNTFFSRLKQNLQIFDGWSWDIQRWHITQLEPPFVCLSLEEKALHTFLALENATEQMCVSWHLELMISQLPERQCILSHKRSMTITFNIIIYTHIIPRDRLSIGCLAAISHPPLIGYHPHFFVKVCDFEVVRRPKSSILRNFIFVFFRMPLSRWNFAKLPKA